jgi:hypothetical protein
MAALRPPTRPAFSTNVTLKPRAASSIAAVNPPGPAPTTTTCFLELLEGFIF